MSLHLRFYERDFGSTLLVPRLDYEIDRFSYNTSGGPKTAKIKATGDLRQLIRLTHMLRTPLEIYDEKGVVTWWGYFNEVRLQTLQAEYSFSLDRMANSIAVEYSTQGDGQASAGTSAKTSFAEDADSIAQFGRKQIILSTSEMDATGAQQDRDRALAELKTPIREVDLHEAEEFSAEILCEGWVRTLSWIYWIAENTNENSGIDDSSGLAYTTGVVWGNGTTTRAGQTLNISADEDFTLTRLGVWLKKTGSPGNVTAKIYTVSGGAPNVEQDSATLSASNIGTSFLPFTFDFTGGATLSAGTDYWIELTAASGDASNYYEVGVNENAPYSGGQFYTYNGSWSADSGKDMVFSISGVRATNTQLENLFDDSDAGQFLAGHEVAATSLSLPARNQDGHMTGLEVLEELLEAGTTNDKRLIAEITKDRYMRITEEPDTGDNYFLLPGNILETESGVRIPKHHIHRQVGIWILPKELITTIGNYPPLADWANIPIVEAEYNAGRDEVRFKTRDGRDVFELVRFGP